MKVILLASTPNPERVIASAGKLCYSPVGVEDINKKMTDEQAEKFVKMLASIGHESPLEHVSFTFAVEGVSRSLTHQLVRHRIASYCLSGDTVVGYDNKNIGLTIKELHEKTEQYKTMTKLRSVNEETKELLLNNVKRTFYSGKKELFEVTTEDGYKIKSTLEHRFLTNNGWKRLKELQIGDIVYTNGEPAYKNKEWLKEKYHKENLNFEQIANICGVSRHCIGRWVDKFGLKKPMGYHRIGREPINKGKTKENYEPLKRVSEKMLGNKNFGSQSGENNTMWKGGINNPNIDGHKLANLIKPKTNNCEHCIKTDVYTEIHHIDSNCNNNNIDNLIEVCSNCHRHLHLLMDNNKYCNKNKKRRKEYYIGWLIKESKIKNIESVGVEDTYDIEMDAPHHNFIANGFVVHNSQQSQRYVKEELFDYIIPEDIKNNDRLTLEYEQHMLNVQEMYDEFVEELIVNYMFDEKYDKYFKQQLKKCNIDEHDFYDWAEKSFKRIIDLKACYKKLYSILEKRAIENARYLFPNATETKIVFTMNLRTLINFTRHRSCERAQLEIRRLSDEMIDLITQVSPLLGRMLGPSCLFKKCPEGSFSCGNPRKRK